MDREPFNVMRPFALLLLVLGKAITSLAQFPMSYTYTTTWADDQLLVIFSASFPYGSGPSCPPFQAEIEQTEDQIQITAIYNTIGAWPTFFCSRVDTVSIPDPSPGICSLSIDQAAIVYQDMGEEVVAFGEPGEIWICSTGIGPVRSNEGFRAYPVPFQDRVHLEHELSEESQVSLLDPLGRVVAGPWIAANRRMTLELSWLRTGSYFIEIRTAAGRHVRMVHKE